MRTSKIAISIDSKILRELDRLVKSAVFPNRSQAVQAAVEEKISRLSHRRLAEECSKLDPRFETALADEGLSIESKEWPEY